MTPQMDFSGTGTVTKRKMKYMKSRRMKYKRRTRRLRFKLSKIIGKPRYRWNPALTYSASWLSPNNGQGAALIPFVSYRGFYGTQFGTDRRMSLSTFASSYPTLAGLPSSYSGPLDIVKNHVDNVITKQFFPSGAAANSQASTWWAKLKKVFLDITITNTGFESDSYVIADPIALNTNRQLEYELYFYWPAPGINRDSATTMNTLTELCTRAGTYQQVYGNQTVGSTIVTSPQGNAFDPKHLVFLSRMFRTRKIGSGYLEVGKSVRIQKSFKPKYLLTKQKYEADSIDAAEKDMAHKRGLTAGVLVVWRGMRDASSTEHEYNAANCVTYPSRLTFSVTNHFYYVLDGNLQRGGSNTYFEQIAT